MFHAILLKYVQNHNQISKNHLFSQKNVGLQSCHGVKWFQAQYRNLRIFTAYQNFTCNQFALLQKRF